MDTISTLLSAGVLSALISGLISFRQQSAFFREQEKRLTEKEKQNDVKKFNFIKKAFLSETKYNISLIEKAEKEQLRLERHYFDVQCYSLFKENIALLDAVLVDQINNLFLELFQANSRIEKLNHTQVNYEGIKPIYLNQKKRLLDFLDFLSSVPDDENSYFKLPTTGR